MGMKKWILLIVVAVISLVGCQKRDDPDDIRKEYMSLLNKELDQGKLKGYIEGNIKLVSAEPETVKSMQFYDFDLEASLNQDFSNLSDEDKYELFKDLDSASLDSFCGENSSCSIDAFTFKANGDTYVVSPTNGFEITLNDEAFDPNPVPVITDDNTETSDSNSTINKQAVYDFMKSKYDEITNYGDNYDPDVHDPLVAKFAAEQFGISESEAGQIYVDMEMGRN